MGLAKKKKAEAGFTSLLVFLIFINAMNIFLTLSEKLVPADALRGSGQTTVLGVQKIAKEDTNKYGILDVKHIEDRVYKVKDMVEKPAIEEAPSDIAILGRYIITPAIFSILEKQTPGKGGEIQLTDALQTLGKQEAIYAYNFEGRRYDVGDKIGFLEATIDFALKRENLKDDLMDYMRKKVSEK